MTHVNNSAMGTAAQIPSVPKRCGSIFKMAMIIKVLKNDRKAEIFPFENAVNSAETKIFIPTIRKLKEKI